MSLVCGVALVLGACGKKGGPSGVATAPTPTAVSLRIEPADLAFMKLRAMQQLNATVTLSDGTTRAAQGAAWSSDAPGVVSVTSSGIAAGNLAGEATVIVISEGMQATRRIRVVPDYQGSWAGSYRTRSCTASGVFARSQCDDPETNFGFRVTFTQDRDTVSGTVEIFSNAPPVPVSGTVEAQGRFLGSGKLTITANNRPFEIEIVDWDIWTADNTQITGQFTLVQRYPDLDGEFREENVLNLLVATTPSRVLENRAAKLLRLPRSGS